MIFNSVDSVLHFILDEDFELGVFTYWVVDVVIVFLPSFVGLRFQIELYRVVSGGNGLDVPVDVVVHLDTLYVIDVQHCEQVHENSHRTTVETEHKSVDLHLLGDEAWTLHEEEGIAVARTVLACDESSGSRG